jgi:RES domain-containing protein
LTPEDRALDPNFFLEHQPLTLFRLARAKYANLSGVGAAQQPGRWNRPGQEAIYTSTEIGVPILERLVHTPKDLIPSNLAIMKIQVSGEWEFRPDGLMDPNTNAFVVFYPTLFEARRKFQNILDPFAGDLDIFAVALPSVIASVWNVVLYPTAPGCSVS